MIRIDNLEEPEDENDLIFKAHNIPSEDGMRFVIPMQDSKGKLHYVNAYIYISIDTPLARTPHRTHN